VTCPAWDVPHPDAVEDALKTVMPTWSGTGMDAFWVHLLELDPRELEKTRRHQMMALARYGRQPLLAWDDVLVTELRAWYGTLAEMLTQEAEARVTEDR
jgi:hypothetical protein